MMRIARDAARPGTEGRDPSMLVARAHGFKPPRAGDGSRKPERAHYYIDVGAGCPPRPYLGPTAMK